MAQRAFPSSGLDLKDVLGSDAKLDLFINSKQINPELTSVPKLGPVTAQDLNRVNILTVNELIGHLLSSTLILSSVSSG